MHYFQSSGPLVCCWWFAKCASREWRYLSSGSLYWKCNARQQRMGKDETVSSYAGILEIGEYLFYSEVWISCKLKYFNFILGKKKSKWNEYLTLHFCLWMLLCWVFAVCKIPVDTWQLPWYKVNKTLFCPEGILKKHTRW